MVKHPPEDFNYSRDELWAFYCEIGLSERHFNTIQEKYRLLASTWLLGAIAAVAYLYTHQHGFPFRATALGAAIGFVSSIGISLLWILDIKVYQSLLSSYYEEGLLLEEGQPWLPQIRTRIRSRFKGKLPVYISVFYTGSMAFLFVIGIVQFLLSIRTDWTVEGIDQLLSSIITNWSVESTVVLVLASLCACANVAVIICSRQSKAILKHKGEEKRLQAYQRASVSSDDCNKASPAATPNEM
jgi:hypothetical protein